MLRTLVSLLFPAAVLVAGEQIPLATSTSESQWTVFDHPIKHVAVVGGGPAGLQAAAKLIEHNFTVRLFERASSPGGNWFYTDETPVRESYPDRPREYKDYIPARLPATLYYEEGEDGISLDYRWTEHWQPRPLWDNLHTNSPKVSTELPDVPYSSDTPWVLSNHDIQKHVRAYASFHNLNSNDYPYRSTTPPVTSYSTRVETIEKVDQIWRLTLRKLERLPETEQIKAQWWTEDFDAIVVATGPYASPHVPDIDGIVDWSKVTLDGQYSIYHSQHYRRPERYLNKTVLIVGASVSASEIARDIHSHAGKIIASVRANPDRDSSSIRSLNRFPHDTEFVPEIERFQPLAENDKGIKEGGITLINGTTLHGIDEIILATGYLHSNIFFPNFTSDGQPTGLHWTGHWISDPTVAYTNVRPWTIGRYQSYAFAKVWDGTARLPSQTQMREEYGKYQFRGLGYPASEALYRQYVAWINNEALIHGGRFVASSPIEDREVLAYYLNVRWPQQPPVTSSNFTEFENLPASEWQKGHRDAWDALVFDDLNW